MLGFSPLAALALSDTGALIFTADSILAGQPSLGTPVISQVHVLSADGVVSGAFVLGQPGSGARYNLSPDAVLLGSFALGSPSYFENGCFVDFNAPDTTQVALENVGVSSIDVDRILSEVAA